MRAIGGSLLKPPQQLIVKSLLVVGVCDYFVVDVFDLTVLFAGPGDILGSGVDISEDLHHPSGVVKVGTLWEVSGLGWRGCWRGGLTLSEPRPDILAIRAGRVPRWLVGVYIVAMLLEMLCRQLFLKVVVATHFIKGVSVASDLGIGGKGATAKTLVLGSTHGRLGPLLGCNVISLLLGPLSVGEFWAGDVGGPARCQILVSQPL